MAQYAPLGGPPLAPVIVQLLGTLPKLPLFRVLHLFSGPTSRKDGISAILQSIGCSCFDVDIENIGALPADQCDLSSDHLWHILISKIRSKQFTFVWMGTPCTTFSRARVGPPGPVALRTVDQIYGKHKSELSASDNEALRLGN